MRRTYLRRYTSLAAEPSKHRGAGYEPPSGTPTAAYDWNKSTTHNYRSVDMDFHGPYALSRARLDYTYHLNFVRRRQKVQDDIVYGLLNNRPKDATFKERPWIVFTAGAMGSGKNYVITEIGRKNYFPTQCFVSLDPDEIKDKLPEIEGYRKRDPTKAYTLTHAEAGFITEIATLEGLKSNFNLLVHGSLRNHEWYARYFQSLLEEYVQYRFAIVYITAPPELVRRRAEARAKITGRVVPADRLENSIQQVPIAIEALRQTVHYCFVIENGESEVVLREPKGWAWHQFAAVFDPNSDIEAG